MKLNVGNAAIRALRTFGQGLAAAIAAAPIIQALSEIAGYLEALAIAVIGAGMTAVATFVQNVVEDNTDLNLPK